MKHKSLKYFTLRYLVIAILGIIAVWAAAFYWLIIEEVYDNIDDGLKDSQARIISEAKTNPEILKTTAYGLAQFKITQLQEGNYSHKTHIYNTEIFIPYEKDDESVRILQRVFSINEKQYQLEIYTSTVEEDELLEDLLTALLILYFALVGSVILINHFVLKKAWAPFYQILKNLQAYKIEHAGSFKKSASKIKEFNNLEEELDAMVQRNKNIYFQQKQFIGNASHELQTPLAIVGNKLELLMEEKDITENQALKINEINKILHRLKRLNKSLLTLSKIENEQFSTVQHVNFNEIIQQSLIEFEELIRFREIKVSMEKSGIFESKINPELAITLINNLIKNAIFHNDKDGWLKIALSQDNISIQNAGTEPLDTNLVFERFYKNEQNEHSTGLGLAIVKSIVGLYPELSIAYHFENGHVFELRKTGSST